MYIITCGGVRPVSTRFISAIRLVAIAACAGNSTGVFAQQTVPVPEHRSKSTISHFRNTDVGKSVPLTLSEAIFLGVRKNRSIRSAYIDRVAQRFDLRVAEDRFTPKLRVSGEINRERTGGDTATNLSIVPSVRGLSETGATFEFTWVNTARLANPVSTGSSIWEISIEQPLLRGRGPEVNLAPVQSARLQERINRLQLGNLVAETVASIVFAYRDLLIAQEEHKLATSAVQRADDLLRLNNVLIAAGRMAQLDSLLAEADLENQKIRVLRASQQVETARLALLDLLGVDLSSPIVATDAPRPRKVDLSEQHLIAVALEKRADYQGQKYILEQRRLGIVVAKNEELWDVALFARGRFGKQFQEGVEPQRVDDITAGIRFDIEFNNLNREQQTVAADTASRTAEMQLEIIQSGIGRQILGSVREINIYWQQLAVAQRALELSKKAVDAEKEKLNVGRSTNLQVRFLEASLRESESQLLAARINYLNAFTRLDLQLGTTLATWKIQLAD